MKTAKEIRRNAKELSASKQTLQPRDVLDLLTELAEVIEGIEERLAVIERNVPHSKGELDDTFKQGR
jgi:hypothetical protein